MAARRDAGLAAAQAALAIARIPEAEGGVATTGELELRPGIATAVAGEAVLSCDLRHPEAESLSRMLQAARATAHSAAREHRCDVAEHPIWRIQPIGFDAELVAAASSSVAAVTGVDRVMASGALHDAAEVARVLPAAMIFCSTANGISHAREEDAPEADLIAGIEAFGQLAQHTIA
jgi:N-carbamoyl-L-amino-acid hydrolase